MISYVVVVYNIYLRGIGCVCVCVCARSHGHNF